MNNAENRHPSRGAIWFRALAGHAQSAYPASLLVADTVFNDQSVRFIAVVPDSKNRYVRACHGEVGLVEGWQLARAVHEVMARDQNSAVKTPIIAIVDVPSQAYGRREEAYGIHLALAAAAGAYAAARLAGHPVVALIVGKAMSGAFLAHGYQANRIVAFDDPDVMVHAMGKASAARITLRSVEALTALAETIPPMAYDIKNFASLGLLSASLAVQHPDTPDQAGLDTVRDCLKQMLVSIAQEVQHDLSSRLEAPHRQASKRVRELLRQQWNGEKPMLR
jgi:malonate decarboxylase gamma subunit